MNTSSIHIAIPCYAGRVFPRFDGASTFCFFEIDPLSGVHTLIRQEACPQGEEVCSWLAQQKVEGVICSGIQREYQIRLEQLGIWLCWGISGPINQAIGHGLEHLTPRTQAAQE
jgi:predicted Fe-Mo cluster-binding NifX family protein